MQLVKTMNLPVIGVFSSEDIPMCCTLHNEQLSYPARIYGNKKIVIFVCEFQLEDSVVPDMVEAIYDFAERHKSGMIYSVEGKRVSDKYVIIQNKLIFVDPLLFRVVLPSGEEVSLQNAEEEETDDEVKTYIDDTKLAELYMKEKGEGGEGNADKPEEEKAGESKHHKKDSTKKKKKKHEDDEEDEEDKTAEQKKEELAEKLYGDKIHYLSTNQEMAAKLRGMGYIPVIDGIITNVSGMFLRVISCLASLIVLNQGGLLARAPFASHDLTVLLAPTSTLLPSPSSAVSLLKLLGTLLPDISICTSELEKLKEDIERVMKTVLKSLPVGAKNVPPSNLYT